MIFLIHVRIENLNKTYVTNKNINITIIYLDS